MTQLTLLEVMVVVILMISAVLFVSQYEVPTNGDDLVDREIADRATNLLEMAGDMPLPKSDSTRPVA